MYFSIHDTVLQKTLIFHRAGDNDHDIVFEQTYAIYQSLISGTVWGMKRKELKLKIVTSEVK